MIMLRPALRWVQALAAFVLLAAMPVPAAAPAEGRALSRIGGDLAKSIGFSREQPGAPRAEGQSQRFDDNGDSDAVHADYPASLTARGAVAQARKIAPHAPRFPRFYGASPRAPPSA
jgi:hypothetical protein